MWRSLAKRASSRKFGFLSSDLKLFQGSISVEAEATSSSSFLGIRRFDSSARPNSANWSNPFGSSGLSYGARAYATAAEAIASATESEEYSSGSDDMHELLERISREARLPQPQLKKHKKMIDGIEAAKYTALKRRQVKTETEAWEAAAKEYQELLENMCQQKLAPSLPYIKSLFLGWFEPLRNAIAKDQKHCKEVKMKPNYAPYIDCLPADKMAVITMHNMMGLLMSNSGETGCCRVVQASSQLGEAIENEARILRFFEKNKKKGKGTDVVLVDESDHVSDVGVERTEDQEKKLAKTVTKLIKKKNMKKVRAIVKNHDDSKPWGQETRAKVGSRLIQLLTETAYIQSRVDQLGDDPPDIRPAFVHTQQSVIINETLKSNKRYGVIQCDPEILKSLEKTARHMVIPYMPMLVPPQKWTGYDRGPYFFLPSYVMRTHGSKQQREVMRKAPKQQLESVYEALDTLGRTKWRVNKGVLDVIERLWANGGGVAGLVDQSEEPLPEELYTEDEEKMDEEMKEEMKKWRWKARIVRKVNSERHSQRCDIELKLAVARKMKNEDGFYYPHNLDFRGRAYPMHPHLNHLGSDMCRGILEFAEGRPLGNSGLRWLKIHLANLYAGGVDKLSYEGREAFTENHLQDIFDSADMPLEGRQWWLGAEDPFQCLATCITLAKALRSSSPETTISHIPVHQDGSCNGLQHYAALGRDKLGAAAVNLVGAEKPADVYSGIAARVHEVMQRDAKKDPESEHHAKHASLLVNQVDRKLVKQTVMTSVYGVTYIGARDQMKKRLKERGMVDDATIYPAACYAAKTTLIALEEMFEAARSIMGWLGDCAMIIAGENKAVQWTTPLGLPVVQPYRQFGRHMVKTSLQVLTLQQETDKVFVNSIIVGSFQFPLRKRLAILVVMAKKQKTAFPPNFVHSLDGTHMMMTALACRRAGLDFAGVHDSYWTHACDVDEMNRILREKFVELYESPVLENLLESFHKSFPHLAFPPLPGRGDFDLRDVLDSPYFFN